jgi:Sec-independent protein secretion pathway component TatC
MPMVDHLEELRRRLLWSLVAAATAAALAVVFAFPVIRVLERPIQAYLPGHKLAFTHPTDPFDIAMHTAIAFGIVAALPIVLHQTWGFVRPAMTRQDALEDLPLQSVRSVSCPYQVVPTVRGLICGAWSRSQVRITNTRP